MMNNRDWLQVLKDNVPVPDSRYLVRISANKGWYSTDGSTTTGAGLEIENSKPSLLIFSARIVICNSPLPFTSNAASPFGL
jgi:hypothetical protein